MKNRFYELDSLRGIAALMVVLYHYTIRYGEIYGHGIKPIFYFEIGKYGVQLFFMISGFVIFLTLNKTTQIKDFLISRFSRLYPAYWVAVFLTYSLTILFSLPNREVSLKTAIINLTMFQTWLKIANVDGVYWTLAIELSFYLIMVTIYITGNLKRIYSISIAWMSIILLLYFLENYYGMKIYGGLKLAFILEYGHLFIAGMMFYKLYEDRQLKYLSCTIMAYMVECVLHPAIANIVGVYFIFFYLLTLNFLSVIRFRPLIFLGAISYSLYLIHQNIGYIVIKSLYANSLANPYSIIFIPLLLSVLIASMMHFFVEKPAMIGIRNFLYNKH